MSWPSWSAWRHRRRSSSADGSRRVLTGALRLDRERCAAGDTLSGSVGPLAGDDSVLLVRIERRPDRLREFTVAEALASARNGTFTLHVPDHALPTCAGERCALRYVVRADQQCAEVVVAASARPHIDAGPHQADRLLASWDARHFHIELCDADLHGGGSLRGRVHRHGSWPDGPIMVTARCMECWVLTTAAGRGIPTWDGRVLWEESQPLPLDPDATWAPFEFQLPGGLPAAVEASTVAWRYELRAQRTVRHWFDETAAVTPLLHEAER